MSRLLGQVREAVCTRHYRLRTVDEKVLEARLLYGTKTLTKLKGCILPMGLTCGPGRR